MADPHHVPDLDGLDRLTVVLYRLGLTMAAVGVIALAMVEGLRASGVVAARRPEPVWMVLVGVLVAAWNMHLYAKAIRWVIGGLAVASAVLLAIGGPHGVVGTAGLGFAFAALSAFALKERYCFRLPGMRLVPLLLAASVVPILLDLPAVTAPLLGVAGVMTVILAVAKLRMPLHVDVGDKSKYQV